MSKQPAYNEIYQMSLLWEAWSDVKTKGAAGGIDKMDIASFEIHQDAYLRQLVDELRDKKYLPHPYQKIHILKDDSKYRALGLLTVRDKIVQTAIKKLIEPCFEKIFLNVSYGYRPGNGPVKAINRIRHIIKHEKKSWIVQCDIDNYFDSIPHELLFKKLTKFIEDAQLQELVYLCIRMGKVNTGGRWQDNNQGVPQGAVLSPLLSNMYLHELDQLQVNNQISYVRYADDFVILCREKKEAERALILTENLLTQELKLTLNPEKNIYPLKDSFEFLGISFNHKGIFLSEKKQEKLKQKLAASIAFNNAGLTDRYQEAIQGIRQYYGKLFQHHELKFLDEHLIHTIVEQLTKHKELTNSLVKIRAVLSGLSFITEPYRRDAPSYIEQIARKIRQKPQKRPQEAEQLIEKRKREYQQLEASQMELIISSYGVTLGKSQKGITVKKNNEKIQRFSSANLRHIIILSSGVTFSSDLIHYCIEHHIAIDFFSRGGKHYATIHQPHEAKRELWLEQVKAIENGKGRMISILLVQAKIRNQINLLKYFHKYHQYTDPGFAAKFEKGVSELKKICKETQNIHVQDIKTCSGILFSIEGRAASIYWELIAELINDVADFKSRTRQGAKDLTNSMLNYGYAILYSRVWDALIRARLNPYISYLHAHQDGKPTLVFDFIEPFRQQAVDRIVVAMLQKGEKFYIENGLLLEESKRKLSQNILERLHRYEMYRGERRRFSDILRIQAKGLAYYLSGEYRSFKPYISKW